MRGRHLLNKIALWIICTVGVVVVVPLIIFFAKVELDVMAFKNRFTESKLSGKTVGQVIKLIGRPDDQVTFRDGSCDLIYEGPHGSAYRVEIRKGAVTHLAQLDK